MKVTELIEKVGLEVLTGPFEQEISGVYVGDLLSNVLAKAQVNDLWVTIQGHQNVVAVASLTGVAAVIVVEDFKLEPEAIARAKERQVNMLRTSLTAYELIRKLIDLGI